MAPEPMPSIHIKTTGTIKKPLGKSDFDHEVPEDTTIEQLLPQLGYAPTHVRFIIAAVNGTQRNLNFKLSDGDELVLGVVVGGG